MIDQFARFVHSLKIAALVSVSRRTRSFGALKHSASKLLRLRAGRNARKYVRVQINHLKDKLAICDVKHQGRWLKIELNRQSVEAQGLKPGDEFEWVPNPDGIVQAQDIRFHPRRFEPGESQYLRRELKRFGFRSH